MNRNLFFIAAALFLWGFGEGMFFNFVPIYLDVQFFLSKYQIGLALGAFGFSMAITHIPAGRLADRIGRKPLLLGAWMLGLIATIIMGVAQSLPLYLVGFFAYGLTAFVSSPLSSYVTAARGNLPVGTVLSLTTATYGLGMTLGPVTGGWVGEVYGMRMSFYAAAIVFVFSNLFLFFIQAQPIDRHDPNDPPPNLTRNIKFITLVSVLTFGTFAMYLSQPLTPNFLEGARGFSLSQVGIIFTFGALGNSLMAIALSRVNPRRGYILAQALVMAFAVLIWKGSALPVFALAYFLLGGFRAARPMSMAQARELIHPSQMGIAYGVIETLSALVAILTPPIAGFLFERDPTLPYPLAIGLIALSIFVSSILLPRKVAHA